MESTPTLLILLPWLRPCFLDRPSNDKSPNHPHRCTRRSMQHLIFCILTIIMPIVSFQHPAVSLSCLTRFVVVSKLFQISLTRMPHRIIFLTPAPTPWMAVCQSNAARCNHRGCRPSLLIVENIQSTQRHLLLIWISPCPHHQPLPIMTLSARLSNLAVHLVQTI